MAQSKMAPTDSASRIIGVFSAQRKKERKKERNKERKKEIKKERNKERKEREISYCWAHC